MNLRDLVSRLRPHRLTGDSRRPPEAYRAQFAPELFVDRLEERRVLAAPTIALPGGAVGYVENDAATVIDATATVTDNSTNYDGGELTVSITANGTANDRLAIRDQGAGAGNISLNGTDVQYDFGMGPVVIGSFAGGTDGSTPLVVTLNSNADTVSTEALIQNVTYLNISDDPSTMARTVQFDFTDGDTNDSTPESETVNVTAVNDQPAVSTNTGVNLNEGDTVQITNAMLAATDPDDGPADLEYTVTSTPANGTLRRDGTALGMNDTFTQEDIDDGLITYEHDGSETTTDSFAFSLADGGEDGTTPVAGTFNFTITAINDQPTVDTNTGTALDEGTTVQITNGMLAASDADDGPSELTYTVTAVVSNGTLRRNAVALGINDTFTQADVDGGLIFYDHDGSETVSDSFDFSLADGGEDGTTPVAGTFNISVTAVNDPPVVGAPGAPLTVDEQTNLAIHGQGFTVSDPDEADAGATATLFVDEGTVTVDVGDSGVIITGGNGTDTVTLSGTIAQLDNLLTGSGTGTITYFNGSDTPSASTTLMVTVNDLGNTGTDPGTSGTATTEEGANSVTINVTDVNDDPVITLTGGAVTYTEGDPPVLIDDMAMLTDPDSPDFDGGTLTISFTVNGTVNDQLAIDDAGANPPNGKIGLSGTDIIFDPQMGPDITIGTFSGGMNGADLVITLNANADVEAVQALLQNITFENTSNAPSTLTRTVQFVLTDGDGGTSNAATRDIDVVSVNDDPVITLTGGAVNYTENNPPILLDDMASLDDPDSPDFDTGVLTVSFTMNGTANDQLAIRNQGAGMGNISLNGSDVQFDFGAGPVVIGTFTGGANGADLVITLNANSDDASVEALMRNITFENTSDDPSTMTRTVQFVLTDGDGGTSNAATRMVTVTAVNDQPTIVTNTGTTVNEGGMVQITTAMLQAADPDDLPGGLTYTITVPVVNGTLLNDGNPLGLGDTFTQADIGSGDITYVHNGLEVFGDAFSFSLADGGEDGTLPVPGVFSITINPVNDPPTITTVPPTQMVTEDTPKTIDTIAVDDVEASSLNEAIQVTLSVSNGTLFFTDLTGVIDMGTNGSSTVVIQGTPAALNAILDNNLQYTPDLNFELTDTLTVDVNDLGVSGMGGPQSVQEDVDLDIIPVNDAPVTTDVMVAVTQDQSMTFPLNVTDVDIADNPIAANLTFAMTTPATVAAPAGVSIGPFIAGTFVNNGDGTFTFNPQNQFDSLAQGAVATVSFNYTASDDFLTSNESTVIITVTGENDDPTMVTITPATASTDEGSSLPVTVTFTDVDVGDTHTIVVNWGDGTSSAVGATGSPFVMSHVYVDDPPGTSSGPPYNINATVADNHNAMAASATQQVLVNNLDPFFFAVTATDVSAIGQTTISGFVMDLGVADTHSLQVNWGDGIVETVALRTVGAGINAFTAQHTYIGNPNPNDPAANIAITLSAGDDDGGSAQMTVEATVPGQGLQTPIFQPTATLTNLSVPTPPPAEVVVDDAIPVEQTSLIEIQTNPSGPASNQYERLVLRRVLPDGTESEDVPLHEENDPAPLDALKDLKQTLANLPPDHYRIYLIREDGTERLVLDIVLKRQLKKQKPVEITGENDEEDEATSPKPVRQQKSDETPPADGKTGSFDADRLPVGKQKIEEGPRLDNGTSGRIPVEDIEPSSSAPTALLHLKQGPRDDTFEPTTGFDEDERAPSQNRRAAALAGLLGFSGVQGARAWRKRVREELESIGNDPGDRRRRRRRKIKT